MRERARARAANLGGVADMVLAALPLGLAVLVWISPDSASPARLQALTTVLTASCGALLIRHLGQGWKRIGSATLTGGIFGWYCYPALFDAFGLNAACDVAQTVHRAPYLLALTAVATVLAVTCLVANASLALHPRRPPAGIQADVTGPAIALLLAGLLPFVLSGQSLQQILSAILASRTEEKVWRQALPLGDATTAWSYLAASSMVGGATLLWAAVVSRGWSRAKIPALLATVATATIYFDHGTRSVFAIIVVPAIVLLLHRLSHFSRLTAFSMGVAAAAVLTLALQFQLAYRTDVGRSDLTNRVTEDVLLLGGTIDFFCETAVSFELVPAVHPYFRQSVALEFALSAIPRFLWPSKPAPEIVPFFTVQRTGASVYDAGGNILPGVIGQHYMNWGWLGILALGLGAGVLSAFLDARIASTLAARHYYRAAVFLMLASWALVSFRLLSPGFLYPVLFAAAAVATSNRQFRQRLARTPSWRSGSGSL